MANVDVFKDGYEACLKNAELWLNEGNMLWEKGSYGHACALYIHGLEGLMHTWYTWLVYIGAIQPENKDFLNSFKNHDAKLHSFWGFYIGQQMRKEEIEVELDLEKEETWKLVEQELIKFNEVVSGLSRDLMKLRNRSIYVNYDSKNQIFESPLDLVQGDAGELSVGVEQVYKVIVDYIHSDDEQKSLIRKLVQDFYSS
ncbi:AbiV family abortive infection protein [Candidatus Bathyarchaeota archaeon]|nr:MAG: AbiV family abortive infection protein [Candidatus Bathyarchaeota archaeon]